MDSDNDSYHFPKCQTHPYTGFENGCSENSTQKLLTKYSTEENNKQVIHIGKNCALGLGYGRPRAVLKTSGTVFHQYGPPGRQITYMYLTQAHLKILSRMTMTDDKLYTSLSASTIMA